jgi:osmoprotectant transport system permease protein
MLLELLGGRLQELWLRTGEHVILTGTSAAVAILAGVPLGILAHRVRRMRGPLLGVIGILQTIPSLAMLAILLTLLNRIGVIPAVIALILYALLPIVRNTLAGLEGVPSDVREASRGIGMTESQQLRMVQLPIALPIILAGVRTAAVVSVGIATLSAFIGAGGLGQFINRGLALSNPSLILLGAIPAGILALAVDGSLAAAGWSLQPTRRHDRGSFRTRLKLPARFLPVALLALGLLAFLTGSPPASGPGAQPGTVRIGSKNFTEQLVLGEILAQRIEAATDLKVERLFNLGGTMICHEALVRGEIDLYPEYTGTALTAVLGEPAANDADQVLRTVRQHYGTRFGCEWLGPFGFDNTYAITVRSADATRNRWRSISDLEEPSPGLRAGFTAEFMEREDGYPGLRRVYDLRFRDVRDLDPALMYRAIAESEVDVICAFATDGRIAAYDLTPLSDDREFFPPYQAAAVVRSRVLSDHPELRAALTPLAGALDDRAMQRLNLQVDGEGRTPADVARRFLSESGLLD